MSPAERPSLSVGDFVDGRYRILQKLGEGGFGQVYLVRDEQLGGDRPLALKLLDVHLEGEDARSRVRREIRLLRELQHPRIPRIHNDGRLADGELYYTMSFVQGETLERQLRDEVMDVRCAAALMEQCVDILEWTHARGVVHRDLKPANIIIQPGPKGPALFLLDFGIAKLLRDLTGPTGTTALATGGVIGTPRYMSPEQWLGEPVGPATDLFSLGVVFGQMTSGVQPRRRIEGSVGIEEEWIRQLPPSVRRLVRCLVDIRADARPSLPQLRRHLRRLARGASSPHRRRGALLGSVLVVLVGGGSWRLWAERATSGGREPSRSVGMSSVRSDSERDGSPEPRPSDPSSVEVDAGFDGEEQDPTAQVSDLPQSRPVGEAGNEAQEGPRAPGQPIALAGRRWMPPSGWEVRSGPEEGELPQRIRHVLLDLDLVLVDLAGVSVEVGARETAPRSPHAPPTREVVLEPFYVATTETTVGQFSVFCTVTGRPAVADADQADALLPITGVSREEIHAFTRWAGLDLPSEDEWEVAAGRGRADCFPWGPQPGEAGLYANVLDRSGCEALGSRGRDRTAFDVDDGVGLLTRVGRYRATSGGLYDVIGNVAERCTPHSSGGDPSRWGTVARGGCFADGVLVARVDARRPLQGEVTEGSWLGFRCILRIEGSERP